MHEENLSICDRCGDSFDEDDMYLHVDGSLYCEDCNYATKQDRLDGYAESCREEMEDR